MEDEVDIPPMVCFFCGTELSKGDRIDGILLVYPCLSCLDLSYAFGCQAAGEDNGLFPGFWPEE